MPVELTDNIAPTGDSGGTPATFSTHLDVYGNGGYRSVADENERLGVSGLLTQLRRKLGMAVYQRDTQKLYILTSNPNTSTTSNSDWTEFTGGAGAGNLQSVIESGGTYLGNDSKTRNVQIIVSSSPTANRSASIQTQVGPFPFSTSNNFISTARLQSEGIITDSIIKTTILSFLNNNSSYFETKLDLDGLNGEWEARSWKHLWLTAPEIKFYTTGNKILFEGLMRHDGQAPLVGDVLTIDAIDNTTGDASVKFAPPSSLDIDMQDVFDNSTPEVAASTDSKRLTFVASDINIHAFKTSNAPTGSEGKVNIMALRTHQALSPFPATLSLEGGEHVTKASLKIGGIGKIYGSSAFQKAEVGDVLVAETVSQAGEVDLKFSTPLPRLNQGWSPIPISQGNIPITITGGDSLAFAVQNICDIAAGQFTVARIFGNLPRLCKINVAVYTGSLTFQGGTSLVYFGSAQVNATAGQPNSYENNIFFVEEPVGTSNNWTPVAGTPVITIIEIDNSNGQDASGNPEDAKILCQSMGTGVGTTFNTTLSFQVPPPSGRKSIFTTTGATPNTALGSQINQILNYGSITPSTSRVCQHFDPFKTP